MGSGTVYRHFTGKKALFETIALGRLEQLVDQAEKLADSDDPAAAFFQFLSLTVEEGSVRRDMVDALAGEDVNASAAVPPGEAPPSAGHRQAAPRRTAGGSRPRRQSGRTAPGPHGPTRPH
ncbi:TetR/AcrR family transcriptional regulator [Streptomyces sp. NPDC059605]|uniref:TetR/AcrR family transcriptional regulator n=1 Tax=unclassified Streptomyces TaxID=2593676 RepID=UPI0036A4FF71